MITEANHEQDPSDPSAARGVGELGHTVLVAASGEDALLGVDPLFVQDQMRQGKITSRYERGIDDDTSRLD